LWGGSSQGGGLDQDEDLLQKELQASIGAASGTAADDDAWGQGAPDGTTGRKPTAASKDFEEAKKSIVLEKLLRPPAKFDLLTNTLAFKWNTTALYARKISGPMREWSGEIKYRTGVHIEVEPTYPEKLSQYLSPDDVDITVYLFGGERAVQQCQNLMYAAVQQDPAYVRLAVFRRVPDTSQVEWLTLRRINREQRPPDIPPISLKTPGKWTMMYEQRKEAALRTLWEETGIRVAAKDVFPSKLLFNAVPLFYWRVPVQYYVAEVPYDVQVLGPQSLSTAYVQGWDARLFAASPDPMDRAWAQYANPVTGCAWLPGALIDELQKPLRGEDYMKRRYTPPPYSNLQGVVGYLEPLPGTTSSSTSNASPAAALDSPPSPGN
jgi:8-oxo-dGTP pyrophosphatase MutT (NUDIX family)